MSGLPLHGGRLRGLQVLVDSLRLRTESATAKRKTNGCASCDDGLKSGALDGLDGFIFE